MSGAGSGIASVIAQQPEMALRAIQLQQQIASQPYQQRLLEQHGALYGAQTALANAQAAKAQQETQQMKDTSTEDTDIGNTFAAIMSGDSTQATKAKLFTGLAHKAKTNPEQLATAFSHMASVFESGMLNDPGLAQAVVTGNKTYGNPVVAGPNTTVFTGTGNDFGPAYTTPGSVPAGGMRTALTDYTGDNGPVTMGQPIVNPRPAGQFGNLFAAALKAKGDVMFPMTDPQYQQTVNQIVANIPDALATRNQPTWQPGMQLPGPGMTMQPTNPPVAVPAPSTNAPSRRGRYNPSTGQVEWY